MACLFLSEEFDSYCEELETTPAWGGQLEARTILDRLYLVPLTASTRQ